MTRITGILTALILLIPASGLHAERPLAAVAGVTGNSPRALNISAVLETHLSNILYSTDIFDMVNHKLLRRELLKFSCIEEKCVLRFARASGIGLLVRGNIDDRGDSLLITIRAYGVEEPFYGKCIHSYKAAVPVTGQYGSREYSYISEEHAGYFVSGVLVHYKLPVYLKKGKQGGVELDAGSADSGTYPVYRYKTGNFPGLMRPVENPGAVRISAGRIVREQGSVPDVREGDFILARFMDRARFLSEFYYGRKREIVLSESSWQDTVFAVLFTAPASASMPVVAPLMGYYRNGDWSGLTLWAVNFAPYFYCEYRGLTNRPGDLRDRNEDLTRDTLAMNRFGAYMFLAGNVSLFVDAFANQYCADAAAYRKNRPVIGNDLTAAYLSLVAGGAGHFYRGNRMWGYLYFHLDNILLYLAIREFSPPERYDPSSGSYNRDPVRRARAWTAAGVFGLVKIVELVHVLRSRDRIMNGVVEHESVEAEPVMYGDPETGVSLGLQLRRRF